MYWIMIIFGFAAVVLLARSTIYEGKLRNRYYQNLFHTQLVKEDPDGHISVRPLSAAFYVIGRRRRKCDMEISDRGVSRTHCVLFYRHGQFWVKPIFHHTRNESYYSKVLVNREEVPPSGAVVGCHDVMKIGQTLLHLQPTLVSPQRLRGPLLPPFLTAGFILSLFAYVRGAAVEIPLDTYTTATVLILAFLAMAVIWSTFSGTPITSLSCAVAVLLQLHNSYMIFFPDEKNYIIHMVIFMIVVICAFLILRHQEFFSESHGVFSILCAAILALMLVNIVFGFGVDGGARLWVRIGGISLQPGEVSKPLLALLGAMCYRKPKRFWMYFAVNAIVCCTLVYLRDFGNVCIIGCMLILMIYLLHDHISATLAIVACCIVGLLTLIGMVPYAAQRFNDWGNAMTNENSFQQKQIIISLLLSGFTGLGPDHHHLATDIFAAHTGSAIAGIAAIYGVPLLFVLLSAYSILVIHCSNNSSVHAMGNLIVMQGALLWFIQIIFNDLGSTDVLFFTGVVAPLISASGSAMISNGLLVGMVASSLCPAVRRPTEPGRSDYNVSE